MKAVLRQSVITTREPQAAYQVLAAACGVRSEFHGLAPGDALSLSKAQVGPVCVFNLSSPANLGWDVAPLQRLVISQPIRGLQARRGRGLNDRLGPGDVAVVAPPDRPMRGSNQALSSRVVCIDLALLAEVAGNDPREPISVARDFNDCRPLNPAGSTGWCRVVDFVVDQVFGNHAAAESPLIYQSATQLIAAAALSLFPNTVATEPSGLDRCDATPLTLHRAREFIEAHAAEDISVADIAVAAGVSVRAIQLSFRQHLDTTPLSHLRTVRLARAHDELRAADPSAGDTVTEIAARWGFFSPGRFSAQYREAYGTLPSETLRN